MELQSLNPKQLLKEFKATQKDVKSKDALLKEGALKKCADNTRYFTEGGCLVPLVLSIAPKKVQCVYAEINLTRWFILYGHYQWLTHSVLR
jgi:hypothetical protein